jgi:hypothetical protein
MPEIHVTDEQGTEHIFPDGSTPEMIAKVLNVKPPGLDFSNSGKQGTYNMWDTQGQMHPVPYGLVPHAAQQGFKFDTNPNKAGLTPGQQFQKDYNYATTGPGNEAAFAQSDRNAPLPMQMVSGVAKGLGTLGKPVMDVVGALGGVPQQAINQSLQAQTPTEGVAKVGTMGAVAAPGFVAAPLASTGAQAGGTIAGTGADAIAHAAGSSPRATAFITDAAGLGGGALGSIGAPAAAQGLGRLALRGQTPGAAMESALRLPVDMQPSQRAAIAQTALNEELPISRGGLDKLYDAVERIDAAKWGEINRNPNAPIDPNAVAQYTARSRNFFSNQVNATQDLNAIDAARQQWLTEQGARPATPPQPTGVLDAHGNPVMTPGTPAQPAQPMSASQAQIMKQTTGAILRKKFGEVGAASAEAQKDLVYGLKEEIATRFPELRKLNQQESGLLDLQPFLEKAVNKMSNSQAFGISAPILGEAVKAVTGSGKLGVVAGIMKGVLDSPMVKSRLAIAVSKGGQIPYSTALGRVNAYAAALGASAGANQDRNAVSDRVGP